MRHAATESRQQAVRQTAMERDQMAEQDKAGHIVYNRMFWGLYSAQNVMLDNNFEAWDMSSRHLGRLDRDQMAQMNG